MPKKFVGENSKAVAARQRKENVKVEKDQKKKENLEDEAWKDDDKQNLKKQQKKDEQERKRQQLLEKKAESKALLENEMETLKNSIVKVQPAPRITRAQITRAAKEPPPKVQSKVSIVEEPLEENLNRVQLDGEVAQSVDEAISLLSQSVADIDKHPEKRMKAAFTAFEETALPRLKAENPTLRLSQLKQMLRKEWLKSPENPLNQKY